MGTFAEAECRGIAQPGHYRARGDIDTKPDRSREFGKECQQDAAGAGAEIQETERSIAVENTTQYGLDDGLGLGPRIERVGRQGKFQAPKFAAAEDAAQRFALGHSMQCQANATRLLLIERLFRMGQELGRSQIESRSDQPASRAARLGESGSRQLRGGLSEQRAELRPHLDVPPSTIANRAAWSSATIASMISSSASPLITLSIL